MSDPDADQIHVRGGRADETVFVINGVANRDLITGQSTAGQLNARGMLAPDGRKMRFYNLGYPTLSLFKDLVILERVAEECRLAADRQ